MGADPELVRLIKEKLESVRRPGKDESWNTNKAREVIKVHGCLTRVLVNL